MSEQNERVMEKLVRQYRKAYYSGSTPLVMVDTNETVLVHRLAVLGNVVSLMAKQYPYGEKYKPYYEFLKNDISSLTEAANFSRDISVLRDLIRAGDDLSVELPNQLIIYKLTQDTWKKKKGEEQRIVSLLRDYADAYALCQENSSPLRCSSLLLYGDVSLIPEDLRHCTKIIKVDYPQTWEIAQMLVALARETGHPYEYENDATEVAVEMSGLSLMQAERNIRDLLGTYAEDGRPLLFHPEERKKYLLEEKKQVLIQKDEVLTLCREDWANTAEELGGMDQYKDWIDGLMDRIKRPEHYALHYGVPAPRGVLLCGVRGCGKSEAAKLLQRQWGISMLRMDVDRLMGGLVGDSERNMRLCLEQAEAMAPVILWIDELDKGLSGAASKGGDNATFKRMFGRLLTWLQEKTASVFVFATANDLSQLPPELFRKGRFDEVFSVFMPTRDECVGIFRSLLRNPDKIRKDAAQKLNLDVQILPRFQLGEGGCDSESAVDQILDMLLGSVPAEDPEGAYFVTGADILNIIVRALAKLRPEEADETIVTGRWLELVKQVIESPTMSSTGDSSASLDEIAGTYVRLLRGSFVPTADPEHQLFQRKGYRVVWDAENPSRRIVRYDGPREFAHKYDQALFRALLPRVLQIGQTMENLSLQKISQP